MINIGLVVELGKKATPLVKKVVIPLAIMAAEGVVEKYKIDRAVDRVLPKVLEEKGVVLAQEFRPDEIKE